MLGGVRLMHLVPSLYILNEESYGNQQPYIASDEILLFFCALEISYTKNMTFYTQFRKESNHRRNFFFVEFFIKVNNNRRIFLIIDLVIVHQLYLARLDRLICSDAVPARPPSPSNLKTVQRIKKCLKQKLYRIVSSKILMVNTNSKIP